MGRLEGKVALISGGASGIGEATTRAMVGEGARVVVADIQIDRGKALAEALGDVVLFVQHDVTLESDWQRTVPEGQQRFEKIDVVMNGAGISLPAPIDECDFDHWKRTQSVNSDGVFLGCKYGVEALRAAGGDPSSTSLRQWGSRALRSFLPTVRARGPFACSPSRLRFTAPSRS